MQKLTFLCLFFLAVVSKAQKTESGIFNGKDLALPYQIIYPENFDAKQRYPVFLFLHGAGERGNDNEKQMIHARKFFIKNDKNIFPGIAVVPQCPEKGFWSRRSQAPAGSPLPWRFDYSDKESGEIKAAVALLKTVIKKNGDVKRIYVGGLSMGGMGTFEAVYRYPKLFAAAIPICGGGDAIHYDKRVARTAFWIFHGADDEVVKASYSQEMAAKLKELGANMKYTEYPGVNHNSWDNAFAEQDILNWLLSKHK